ncbi:MAG: DNA recombination protein RmuC [Actinomycetota bacterium]|jgi:DNA recombination protein RmuC|nr:DNA recombination protein RmuC [Actinomycetota bacterium]
MEIFWVVVLTVSAALVGMAVGWALSSSSGGLRLAALGAERDLLAERLSATEGAALEDRRTAAELAPLRAALVRVESHVRDLERDRLEQFGQVGERLSDVAAQTAALREQTAGLSGALNSSGIRGSWGEAQLRRVLEHAGMLAHCDFEEQVGGVSAHDVRVRPDVVVHLPGNKCIVIDSKAPMSSFLQAQAEALPPTDRAGLLRGHARALRGHVDTLAAKAYWSAFSTTPEMVVCFVPSDAVLAAALQAEPGLYDHAQARRVVLASPATLLAVLRALAYAWQQEALAGNARELLRLGSELHQRLTTLGRHVGGMGTALRRSVEAYNAMVGTLESRVMVTSRRMHELGLTQGEAGELTALDSAPRPLATAQWIDDELEAVAQRPRIELQGDESPTVRDRRSRGA